MAAVSLLRILQQEDGLVKERELNFERRVHMLHTYEDLERYCKCQSRDEDLAKLQVEIDTSKQRENEIDLELIEVRKRIRRYAAKLLES